MHLQEPAQLNALDEQSDDKCPFCYKAPHEFPGKKAKEPSTKVVSKPKALGCADLPGGGPGRYTTAAHHLIPAIQCYARVRRIVRMGSLAGYDVNSSPNGMGLPTIKNKYRGKNYRDLDEHEKNDIAFQMMHETQAQWHVGNHSFEASIPQEWVDESGEDREVSHCPAYDNETLSMLIALLVDAEEVMLCQADNEQDGAGAFVESMNDISAKIAEHLEMFRTSAPWKSDPFFVSERALQYAMAVKRGIWPEKGGKK